MSTPPDAESRIQKLEAEVRRLSDLVDGLLSSQGYGDLSEGGKSLQQVKQERGAAGAASRPAPQDLRDTHWR
jgi:hypothetical protein